MTKFTAEAYEEEGGDREVDASEDDRRPGQAQVRQEDKGERIVCRANKQPFTEYHRGTGERSQDQAQQFRTALCCQYRSWQLDPGQQQWRYHQSADGVSQPPGRPQ